MDVPFISPPAKRSIELTTNGPSSKRSKPQPLPLSIPAGNISLRLLCNASRIGGVIGKSGASIKQLQQSTSAKIRIEDAPPGCEDRVIVIIASNSIAKRIRLSGLEEEFEVSAAQEALVRVFERVIDVAVESDGLVVGTGSVVSCRLLAERSQASSVIGKGGNVVKKIREDTGCKIRVLSSDKLPACASPTDEMVEIEGDILAIKKALVAVSQRLQDCPQLDKTRVPISRPLEAVPQETLLDMSSDLPPPRSSGRQLMPPSSANHASGGRLLSLEADMGSARTPVSSQQEVVFRILCSNDRVGGVIGKGGTIIRALQNETGASVTIGATVAECDERLITVTAMENPESKYSPAQNAVVLVFNRFVEAGIEKGLDSGVKGSPISARLVVLSNQVGCLMGKGGTIISEIRKVTGVGIRIMGGNEVPKCAPENDHVVQITGEIANVQSALYNVTSRLRENLFPTKMPNGAGTRSSSSVFTEISPYGRARDPPALGLHSSVGVSQSLNRHTIQGMDHFERLHDIDRPPSPRLWPSQTEAGLNPRSSFLDVGRGFTSVKGGLELGSGNRTAIVTNTTVEIVVPENVVGSIYGENGSNLARLRKISGAKVVVHEPRPGTRDRVVIISGSPDETQAAQSLLHAFILTGPL